MSESKRLQGALARKYLGKRGSHGISIDESNHTVNVYVEQKEAVAKLRRSQAAQLAPHRDPRRRGLAGNPVGEQDPLQSTGHELTVEPNPR